MNHPAPEGEGGSPDVPRLGPWLFYTCGAASAVVFVDWVMLVVWLPFSGSDPLGLLAYLVCALSLQVAALSVPVIALAKLIDSFEARGSQPLRAASALAWLGAAALELALLAGIDRALPDGQHLQFPWHIACLRWALFAFATLACFALGRALLEPLATRFVERGKRQIQLRTVLGAHALLVYVAAALTVCLWMAPVHLDRLTPPFVLLSGVAFACALRLVVPPARVVGARALAFSMLGLFACALAFSRHPKGRFLLFAHAPMTAPLARLARDVLDFDGDGALPTALGGTDCAPFDETRGPAVRERPGDGVDQDCQGGDAPARKAPRPGAAGLIEGCALASPVRAVLLVTLDAFRSDNLDRPQTPALSRFAGQVVRFERAYATATFTFKALAGLFSMATLSDFGGDNPLVSQVHALDQSFVAKLARAGFRTGMVNYIETERALTTGFAEQNPEITDAYVSDALHELGSAKVTNTGLSFLDRHRNDKFFLWLHYADAHAPYRDPKFDDARAAALSPYERAIAYVDLHVGRLLSELSRRGLASTTAIFVTADHGEDLGERGHLGHGPDAYETTTRVPLLAWIPGCRPSLVRHPVSLRALGATVGLVGGVPMAGATLLDRPSEQDLPVVTEALYDEGRYPPGTFLRAIVDGDHKLIVDVRNGGRVMFDLAHDPRETDDLYGMNDRAARRLEAVYQRWLDR